MPKRTIVSLSQDAPTTPYKKRGTISTRSKATRKRGLQLLSAPGTPFPTRCKARLRYTSYVNLDLGAAAVLAQHIRCNSIYDPDATGIGGQPRGFDQYAQLYDQYTVNASSVKAWIVNATNGTGGEDRILAGISIVDDASLTPSIDSCADRPFTNFKVCTASQNMSENCVRSSWNRLKRFPNAQTYQTLSAQIAANPSEQEYYQIWIHSAFYPLTTNPGAVTIQYEAIYDVEFYELKQIQPS